MIPLNLLIYRCSKQISNLLFWRLLILVWANKKYSKLKSVALLVKAQVSHHQKTYRGLTLIKTRIWLDLIWMMPLMTSSKHQEEALHLTQIHLTMIHKIVTVVSRVHTFRIYYIKIEIFLNVIKIWLFWVKALCKMIISAHISIKLKTILTMIISNLSNKNV